MGAETALALGVATLLGGGMFGMQEYSKSQDRKAAKSAASNMPSMGTGALTPEEAKTSASKKMFRAGLYYTSPTGVEGVGSRGRSRLFGS